MKLAFAVIGLGLLAAPAALAGPTEGEALFTSRCALCHAAGIGGAPLTDKLKGDAPEAIIEKLTNGTMAPMAAGMSDEDKRDIAAYLSGKELPASTPAAADAAAPAAAAAAPAADAAAPAPTQPTTTDPAAPTTPAPQ